MTPKLNEFVSKSHYQKRDLDLSDFAKFPTSWASRGLSARLRQLSLHTSPLYT